ncbi:MAG: antitoxin VapB family protein [Candidatus Helarchaeota archaeon]
MTTKTITIREEAYRALKNLKLGNESFSDTNSEYEEELQRLEENRMNFHLARESFNLK